MAKSIPINVIFNWPAPQPNPVAMIKNRYTNFRWPVLDKNSGDFYWSVVYESEGWLNILDFEYKKDIKKYF